MGFGVENYFNPCPLAKPGGVQGPSNPQALNRFAYGLNNPLGFTDPTGHVPCRAGTKCLGSGGVRLGKNSNPSGCNTSGRCKVTTSMENNCRINRCRNAQVNNVIGFYAKVYGIPKNLLGATLMTEAIDDQQLLGEVADAWNRTGLGMMKSGIAAMIMPPQLLGPAPITYTPGIMMLYTMDAAERLHGSPGIGANNIHIDTARTVESYFATNYPNSGMANLVVPGRSMPAVIDSLSSSDGNIRYAAAYVRLLSDLRTNSTGEHMALSDVDMAIIYGAYRAGPESYGERSSDFRNTQTVGTFGSTFLEYLNQYR